MARSVMDHFVLVMLTCFLLFGAAVIFAFWMLSSNHPFAKWALSKVERINEILTFGRTH